MWCCVVRGNGATFQGHSMERCVVFLYLSLLLLWCWLDGDSETWFLFLITLCCLYYIPTVASSIFYVNGFANRNKCHSYSTRNLRCRQFSLSHNRDEKNMTAFNWFVDLVNLYNFPWLVPRKADFSTHLWLLHGKNGLIGQNLFRNRESRRDIKMDGKREREGERMEK